MQVTSLKMSHVLKFIGNAFQQLSNKCAIIFVVKNLLRCFRLKFCISLAYISRKIFCCKVSIDISVKSKPGLSSNGNAGPLRLLTYGFFEVVQLLNFSAFMFILCRISKVERREHFLLAPERHAGKQGTQTRTHCST